MRARDFLHSWVPFAFLALVVSASTARAQRVAAYDFSTQQPKDRVRQPKPFPAGATIGGKCGGIFMNPPLRVSLLALDRSEYALGDEVVFTIKITNTGSASQRVPVTFQLADIEPPDASQSYGYEPMEIWLRLSTEDAGDKRLTLNTLLLTLYGSNDRPDTQYELKAREWLEIEGRAKLEDTSTSGKRYLSDYGVVSSIRDVKQKIPELKATATSWRGDIAYFEGRTQHETRGCREYEASEGSEYTEHVALVPPKSLQ